MFSFFIPTFIRITVAAVFAYQAVHHFKHKKAVAAELGDKIRIISHEMAVWAVGLLILAELVLAVLLFVGAWTQIAALLAVLGFGKMTLFKKKLPQYAPLAKLSYVLLMVMCISLLFSGAGAFAFDLPL
jgi:hypothetical protein